MVTSWIDRSIEVCGQGVTSPQLSFFEVVKKTPLPTFMGNIQKVNMKVKPDGSFLEGGDLDKFPVGVQRKRKRIRLKVYWHHISLR